jgi:hypothetical protein
MRLAVGTVILLVVTLAIAVVILPAGGQPPKATGIFVADRLNGRIVYMKDMAGAGWTTFGSSGTGKNQFTNPSGLSMDAAGRIYIADRNNNRIVRINDLRGAGWTTLGTPCQGVNQFVLPYGVVVHQSAIYVAVSGQGTVCGA